MKFTSGLFSRQALRSMEAVDSPKPISVSPNSNDRSFQSPRNIKENGPNASVAPAEVANNDPVVSFPGMPTTITTDVVENGATHSPQKKRAFRMREPKDSMEHDDKTHYNGSAPILSTVKMGTVQDTPTYGKSTPPEVPKSVKVTIPASEEAMATPQSVVVPFSTAAFKKPMELNNPSLFNSSSTIPTPSEVTATPPSVIVPFLSSAFKKPEESTNSSSFSCISKSAEKFSALPSDYSKKLQPKVESTSSFVDVTASAGSQGKIPKSDRFGHVNPQAGDTNYKSVTVPHAEGQHVSISSPVSVTASASDAISSGGVLSFTSSTSISTVNPSSGTPSANNSGLAGNPSNFPGSLFKFGGTSVDPAVSIPNISEVSDTRTKVDIVPSSGSSNVSNSSATAPDVAKTESRMAGLGSSVSQPILSLQGSLFGSVPKPVVFGAGTVSQGTTLLPVSSASSAVTTSRGMSVLSVSSAPPQFFDIRINSSNSSSNPQVINSSNSFGFSSSAFASETNATALPCSGAASSVFKFGAGPISKRTGVAMQNPSPFQASSSLDFNTGGSSFSLGSGGDKSSRRIVKISRSKNRKR